MGPETGWNEEWSFKLLTGFKNWLWIEDDSEGNLMIAAKSNDGTSRSSIFDGISKFWYMLKSKMILKIKYFRRKAL